METGCRDFIKGMLDLYKTLPVNQLRRYAVSAGVADRTFQRTVDKMIQSGVYEYNDGFIQIKNPCFTSYESVTPDPRDSYRIERGIHKAFVVFMDFILKMHVHILTHFLSIKYPYIMVFATDQDVYEVMYAENGKERLVSSLIEHWDSTSAPEDNAAKKRIVIIDNEGQRAAFKDRNVELFAVVDEAAGKSTYFGGGSF